MQAQLVQESFGLNLLSWHWKYSQVTAKKQNSSRQLSGKFQICFNTHTCTFETVRVCNRLRVVHFQSAAVNMCTVHTHTHTCTLNLEQDFKHSNSRSKHRLNQEFAPEKTKNRHHSTAKPRAVICPIMTSCSNTKVKKVRKRVFTSTPIPTKTQR